MLISLTNWASARDVGTLVKSVFRQLFRTVDPASQDPIRLDKITMLTAFDVIITKSSKRAKDLVAKIPVQPHFSDANGGSSNQNLPPPPPPNVGTQTCQPLPQTKDTSPEKQGLQNASADPRDPDVSDEAWAPLQLDKQATATRDKHYHELLARQAELEAEHAGKQEEDEDEQRLRQEQRRQEGLQHRHATTEEAEAPRLTAEEDEAKRRLEQERVRHDSERRKRKEELV